MTDPTLPTRDERELTFPYEFRLSRPVKAHGEDVQVLVLREPTGADVLQFGLLDGLDSSQFAPLVVKLASVPMSTFEALVGADVLRLATVLGRFFTWAAQPS